MAFSDNDKVKVNVSPPGADVTALAPLPDGGKLAYTLLGPAPEATPPLLLHRPLGGSMALWGDFASTLARHFRVIAFDPRGVGHSSDVPPGHTTRAMARDACALLDFLGVRRAHVFGLSLGGMVASWQAIDAPERIVRLVLASTLPDSSSVSVAGLARATSFIRCYLRPGSEAEICLVHKVLSPGFCTAHPRRCAEIERTIRRVPAHRRDLLRLAIAAARHHAGTALRGARQETLLLFGALDPFVTRSPRAELLRDCPHGVLELIDGVGHDLTLEAPVETAERVIAFLAAAPGQSDGPSGH